MIFWGWTSFKTPLIIDQLKLIELFLIDFQTEENFKNPENVKPSEFPGKKEQENIYRFKRCKLNAFSIRIITTFGKI